MAVAIVAFYGGLNALIVLVLAVLVTRQRFVTDTMIGAGDSPAMLQAMRAHANAAEYVPIILLLLLLLALLGLAPRSLHALGIALTVGRLLHGWGLSRNPGRSFGRFVGMLLTWAVMAAALALCLALAVAQL